MNNEKVRNLPLHNFRMRPGESLPFEINSFDRASRLAQAAFPHRHTFYNILYITGGLGTHYIDFESYPLQPPTLYFISAGQVHFWDLDIPLEGHTCLFTEDFLFFLPLNQSMLHELSFFHSVINFPVLRLGKKQAEHINTLIQTIFDEYHSDQINRASVLRAYLHILLVQIQRMYDFAHAEGKAAKEPSLVRRFKQLVSQNFATERSIQAYANRLGVSANHLLNTVKAVTEQTPGQIIRSEIALEARRLLAHSDLNVAEIGYTLAFEDPSYFGRFFRRETGMSPRNFRQHIQEKYQIFPE